VIPRTAARDANSLLLLCFYLKSRPLDTSRKGSGENCQGRGREFESHRPLQKLSKNRRLATLLRVWRSRFLVWGGIGARPPSAADFFRCEQISVDACCALMRVRIGRSNWCAAYRSLTCDRYANPALADEAVGLKLSRFVTSRDFVIDIMPFAKTGNGRRLDRSPSASCLVVHCVSGNTPNRRIFAILMY